ncbi:unnamed protein product, partial [marine sediment metagenome]
NTPEAKAKISATLKEFWRQHPETRARCGRIGMPHTKETKAKMRVAALANHGNSLLQLGEQNHFYGKNHTEEVRQILSMANKGRLVGEKNPSWRGGISREPYPWEFNNELKEQIRNRDNRLCQLCAIPEVENLALLSIHHINYIKEDIDEKNLISLCRNCHGKVQTNIGYWQGHFASIIAKIYARKGGDEKCL